MPERNDLVSYTEHLGYVNAPFHIEWINLLQHRFSPLKFHPSPQWMKELGQLWPRGHAKTTITSIEYPSWLIGKYPDIHINICSKTATLSTDIVTMVGELLQEDKYIEVFGDLKPQRAKRKRWTGAQLVVKRNEISKEATLKATGMLGSITGGRSDLIVCDDIIDQDNVMTRNQRKKTSTWLRKKLWPTLYPWGGIIIIGTRWHHADIYSELMEQLHFDMKTAIQLDAQGHRTDQVLWPEYWPMERLLEREKQIGTVFFNCQYQNDPTSMEGELLKADWLHNWKKPPLPGMPRYFGVDPALGEGHKQAITVYARGRHDAKIYHIATWIDLVPLHEFYKQLIIMNRDHKPVKIYVETNAFQEVIMHEDSLRGLPMVKSPTDRNKERRFLTMGSHYQAERVEVNPKINNQQHEFWTEWVQFPYGEFDDGLASAEIALRNLISIPVEEDWVLG